MAENKRILPKLLDAAIFIAMEVAAFAMLSKSSTVHGLWLDGLSSSVRATLWSGGEQVKYYFSLRKVNEDLALENFELQQQLDAIREQHNASLEATVSDSLPKMTQFIYTPATIVKISRNSQHNYIILNKGSEDGVMPQSGIITSKGVVGIVDKVEAHHSYGITLMNTAMSFSVRMGHDGIVVPLGWDGLSKGGAILKEVPLQTKYEPGDTVWTSGYSTLFPSDIPIGTLGDSHTKNGIVNEIKVNLFEDFSSLRFVTITRNTGLEEIERLESADTEQK